MLTVLVIVVKKKRELTNYYSQCCQYLCFGAFISPIYTISLAGNIFVCTPSQGTNRGKYSYNIQHQRTDFRLWRELSTFPSNSSLIGRILSIFRRKMAGSNPSKKITDCFYRADISFHKYTSFP